MNKQRYYGLTASSLIYKGVAVFAILFALGGVGYLTVEGLNLGEAGNLLLAWWLPRVVTLLAVCGLVALTAYVLAQLIDVQLSTNERLNKMIDQLEKLTEATGKLKETDGQIGAALERQNRLLALRENAAREAAGEEVPLRLTRRDLPGKKAE
jgi:membrane protein implicated in regulation of membrane protease activity